MDANNYSWLDLHAHLNMLDQPAGEIIQLALQNGVERIVTIGTNPEDNPIALSLAKAYYPSVHCCLGIHPHDASSFDDKARQDLIKWLSEDSVIGVGEIGLDYYYEHSPREVQKEVFRKMLQMSLDVRMPVQIHTRDAEEDTVEILKEFKGQIRGIIHCFTGTRWLAEQVLDLGLNISFSGIVTFKSAAELREVVKATPLDRLHIETDSPFLTPMPHRGKPNDPSKVIHTAECVAQLKGVSLEELSKVTKANAKKLFTKLSWS